MKKIILTYGLIAGAIEAIMMFVTVPMYRNGSLTFDKGEVVGYTTMVIALSMIFFGTKSYRDNVMGGEITFWQGAKIGLLITVLTGVLYSLAWEITLKFLMPEFNQVMMEYYINDIKNSGLTEAEIQAKMTQMQSFAKYYEMPVVRLLITILEITPVGLLVTGISAGLLRKKTFMPATETVVKS